MAMELNSKDKVYGDCWRCAIAAIIGRDAQLVPHFLQEFGPSEYDAETAKWLRKKGYEIIYVDNAMSLHGTMRLPMIAVGPTERSKGLGKWHSVVYKDGKMVYDPHPSEAGLTLIAGYYIIVPIE